MILVRYLSRGGNTKLLAEAIASEANVEAKAISEEEVECDLLVIGGALYAYGIDKGLKEYISKLDNTKVKKALVFSTSWISKHAITLIKKALAERNIEVIDDFIYARGKPNEKELSAAKAKIKNYLK